MSSVIGHALGAVVVWEAGRRLPGGWVPRGRASYLAPALVAVAPDLDTIIRMAVGPAAGISHRGASHSVLIAAVLACMATAVVCVTHRGARVGRVFAVLFGCALVHPLFDSLMAGGRPVPFLWPFVSRGWLSPVQLVPTAYYARTPGGLLALVVRPGTWAGVGLELLSLGPLWLALRSRRALTSVLCVLVSLGGFLLTYFIYN
jgi:membrane-bound metal-dependent hydrolase YbcI (DUF457 family)